MIEGSSFEDYLEKYGSLTYTNVGTSMLPLIRQGRDMFVLQKKGLGRCQKGDVVLYRRPPDKYILHRIIGVRPDGYVILGDNCIAKEYGIHDEDIIGVMTGFVRNGKQHSVEDIGYRLYSVLWIYTAPIRITAKKGLLKIRRLTKRNR